MISATEPIHRAISWTEQALFKPFQIEKWFVLGFCAFLAQLGQGGYNYNYRSSNAFQPTNGSVPNPFEEIWGWITAHQALAITLGASFLLVVLGLTVLFIWLSSRGQFMFLDGVARNRAAVREPWHRFRDLGNRLFRFRLAFAGIFLMAILLLVGPMTLVIFHFSRRGFDAVGIATLIALGLIFFVVMMVGFIVDWLLRDFGVPVMYLRGVRAWESLGILWREIMPGNGWAFVRFYLMKLVLSLGSVVIILIGCCITCCIAALPYLSSVAFLPIHMFFRAYSLSFLEQFGEEWRVLGAMEPLP